MDWSLVKESVNSELGDISGALSGYGQVKQIEQAQLNFGQKKQAMRDLAKQVGMMAGYENKIEMAKDEDALATIASEIVSYGNQKGIMELARGTYGSALASADQKVQEQFAGLSDEERLNPTNVAMMESARSGAISEGYRKGVFDVARTVDEAKALSALNPESKSGALTMRDMNRAESLKQNEVREDRLAKQNVKSEMERTFSNAGFKTSISELRGFQTDLGKAVNDLSKVGLNEMPTAVRNEVFGLLKLPANELTNRLKEIKGTPVANAVHQARASIKLFLQSYLKAMSGVAVSEGERSQYENMFGDALFASDESLLSTLNAFVDRVKLKLKDLNTFNGTYGHRLSDGSTYRISDAFNETYGGIIDSMVGKADEMRSILPTLGQAFPQDDVVVEDKTKKNDEIGALHGKGQEVKMDADF